MMKGNYQQDEPMLKISPEAAGDIFDEYQVQQYTMVPATETKEVEEKPVSRVSNVYLEV